MQFISNSNNNFINSHAHSPSAASASSITRLPHQLGNAFGLGMILNSDQAHQTNDSEDNEPAAPCLLPPARETDRQPDTGDEAMTKTSLPNWRHFCEQKKRTKKQCQQKREKGIEIEFDKKLISHTSERFSFLISIHRLLPSSSSLVLLFNRDEIASSSSRVSTSRSRRWWWNGWEMRMWVIPKNGLNFLRAIIL